MPVVKRLSAHRKYSEALDRMDNTNDETTGIRTKISEKWNEDRQKTITDSNGPSFYINGSSECVLLNHTKIIAEINCRVNWKKL